MRRVANAQCLDHYLVLACRVVSLDEVLDHVHSRDAGRDLGRVDARVYPVGGLGRVLAGRDLGDRREEEVAGRARDTSWPRRISTPTLIVAVLMQLGMPRPCTGCGVDSARV